MLRDIFLKKLVMILFLLPPGQDTSIRPSTDKHVPNLKRVEHMAHRHEIEKAVENISENIPALKKILTELDDSEAALWRMHTADKIPSQAVAVIELMAATGIDPDGMCPRRFFAGERRFVITDWMNKAAFALDAFTMKKPRKEKIRKECLENIQRARHSLARDAGRKGPVAVTAPQEDTMYERCRRLQGSYAASPQGPDAARSRTAPEKKGILQWKTPVTVSRHRPPDVGGRVYGRPL